MSKKFFPVQNRISLLVFVLCLGLLGFIVMDRYNLNNSPMADVNYVTCYGQSLSVGWNAKPIVSVGASDRHIMFPGGIRPYETTKDRSAFVGLKEEISSDQLRGETPLSGMTEMFTSLYKPWSFFYKNPYRFLCTANGVGGISIYGLTKGSGPYKRILEDLQQGKNLSDELGVSFKMPAFLWMQGETNQMDKTDPKAYKEALAQLIRDINDDAQAITGQTQDVLCFGYQMTSHLTYYQSNPTWYAGIAQAQLELALDPKSGYIMVAPVYMLPCSDGVHLTGVSSKLYGEYVGYVMKKVLVDGLRWTPIHPHSHIVMKKEDGFTVTVKFNVPVPPLRLDTDQVTNPGNYGFCIKDKNHQDLTIKEIKLVDANRVAIKVAQDPKGATLYYGMNKNEHLVAGPSEKNTGARGCLRDSQGDDIKANIANKEYRMDNWTPFFKYAL